MNKSNTLKITLEILWWIITAIAVWAVLYPIYKAMHVWPFEITNVFFVVVLITLTRYIFLLRHTFINKQQVLKIALMLLMFPLCFWLIERINEFLGFIEEQTWEPLTGHLPISQRPVIEDYIWAEMLFFGVGSAIAAPAFAIRMMLSIWRTRNRGTI
ncbi:MAG: hypothetical protein ACKVT2_07135 [Saprospiraceae bacterium]